ncbi:MAG: glycosyltransferase family A protein [Gammaproteobacteria bacterium]|nr:glycosyltransferase family A protein [Gammaproteobacteria bacterium]
MSGIVLTELPAVPCVSIILATNRPRFLKWAVINVQRQNYPRLELILALHGDDFDRPAVEHAITPLACPVEIIQISEEHGFPVVLNAATAAANGELVTKMDDDDLYDEHHVWDLVLAHQYSRGHLIGKGAEIVYLQRRNQTIERYRQAETYSRSVAGGTLLIARDHIDVIGGWQGVPPNVDSTLIDNVIRSGGLVYRTHGNGYVLIRHGQRHSWNADDDYFLDGAGTVHNTWRPDLAGIEASSQRLRT